VGWISRWLFKHHDRERFQIHTYLVGYLAIDDFTQNWFVGNSDRAYRADVLGLEILKQMEEDELDILVDLDSITSGHTCQIFARKLAPIQVSWLGWDASGLPSIDYLLQILMFCLIMLRNTIQKLFGGCPIPMSQLMGLK
jgi:predicted O-linked N-acetylglucosamine transferase (SPINDLY family)